VPVDRVGGDVQLVERAVDVTGDRAFRWDGRGLPNC
jgi:hypothetical protein